MGADSIRVVIAEDEMLIRRGLEAVLEGSDFTIVRTVGTAADLVAAVRDDAPGLVITDIRMPPGYSNEGLAAALEIRGTWPATPLCVLSQYVLARSARALLDMDGGGIGYLLKQRITHINEFLSDLRRIVGGEAVLDPTVVEQLLNRADQAGMPIVQLTPRQRAVLALLAEGRSNAAIAARLFISEKTVVNHITSIYTTLGLQLDDDSHRRVQAVLAYLSSR
ncbi:MAG: response regulator transcription factor [Gallionellaceae bacterium]|jgi:DNA-binding NarL/FixJ family response regulator|nr:response regulator transcription factor [Gallionellaceae bacterium]